MKRIVLLAAVIAALLALPILAVAQEEKKVDPTVHDRAVLAYVQGPPITNNICHEFDRYNAVEQVLSKVKTDPSYATSIGKTEAEMNDIQAKPAEQLLYYLAGRQVFFPMPTVCYAYLPETSMTDYLELWDDYRIIKGLRKIFRKHPKLAVGLESELARRMSEFATKHGPEMRKKWLIENDAMAAAILYNLITDEHVPPSVIGLTKSETAKLLEGSWPTHCCG